MSNQLSSRIVREHGLNADETAEFNNAVEKFNQALSNPSEGGGGNMEQEVTSMRSLIAQIEMSLPPKVKTAFKQFLGELSEKLYDLLLRGG